MSTTCIRNASWVVAWDESAGEHRYLRDGDVVFSGDTIDFVGKNYTGPVDTEVDGKDLVILPGFVDIHAHPALEPINKGIREEHGVPEMYMIGLYERMQAFVPDPAGMLAAAEVAYAELLKSGVTTVVDLMFPFDGWLEILKRSGLRCYAGPWYGAAGWKLENRHELKFVWDEAAGRRDFRSAIDTIEKLEKEDPSGLIKGILCGGTIETITEELIRDSIAYAAETQTPFTTHGSQSVLEFLEMTKRHGKSPIQWAESVGMLGPHTILGHGVMIDEHSWIHWHTARDVDLLAETGTTVAHCPTPFSRYGQMMEDLGRYMRAGINIGMGTDTFPHNMIEEIRSAAVFARIAAEDINTLKVSDVFAAATVGGANALERDDLGRLKPGAKADIVVVDGHHVDMRPLRDPLRSLIFSAADRAVRDVYVNGTLVLENSKTLTLDPDEAADRLTEAQIRMEEACPGRDYERRRGIEVSPLSLPPFGA